MDDLVEEHGDKITGSHAKKAVEGVFEATAIREELPPKTRSVVEEAEDSSMPRSPAQMRHLKNIADKRGDGKAAETAERVANGEFKSTFDAYLEVKAPEPERNALSALSAALEAVGKIDPQAVAQEARTASEAAARARECARAQSILKTAEQALVRREQDLRSLAIRNAGRG